MTDIHKFQYGLCLSRLVGGSRLGGTDLSEAKLGLADLREADFRWADLCGANLRGADLRDANLRYANLKEASKYGKKASPVVCALAMVGAPWYCIDWEWSGRELSRPDEYDHWSGLAKLYILGEEDTK